MLKHERAFYLGLNSYDEDDEDDFILKSFKPYSKSIYIEDSFGGIGDLWLGCGILRVF